jgi:hypothetical protein
MFSLVLEYQKMIVMAEPIQVSCHPDILGAVFNDFFHPALFPPFKGRKTVCTFLASQGLLGQVIQGKTIPEYLMDFHEKIKGGQAVEIKGRQAGQHLIIKADDVKADDKVQLLQMPAKGFDILLKIGMKRVRP